jgi:7,8-dihydropterin-6-yl-methyl-4-(beta-D-ribofuranosyl)aminobenzene 5'-phosphate synthase
MCQGSGELSERDVAAPREIEGPAVDPVALLPVDEIAVTTLVDNTFDALLVPQDNVARPPMGTGVVTDSMFEGGRTMAGLVAEHGFSALVRVRRAPRPWWSTPNASGPTSPTSKEWCSAMGISIMPAA